MHTMFATRDFNVDYTEHLARFTNCICQHISMRRYKSTNLIYQFTKCFCWVHYYIYLNVCSYYTYAADIWHIFNRRILLNDSDVIYGLTELHVIYIFIVKLYWTVMLSLDMYCPIVIRNIQIAAKINLNHLNEKNFLNILYPLIETNCRYNIKVYGKCTYFDVCQQ